MENERASEEALSSLPYTCGWQCLWPKVPGQRAPTPWAPTSSPKCEEEESRAPTETSCSLAAFPLAVREQMPRSSRREGLILDDSAR